MSVKSTRVFTILAMCLISAIAHAQTITTPRVPSPAAEVSQTVGISKITVNYSRPSVKGREIWGKVVPYGTDDSGMFWFFNSSNWEMLIKVLRGCSYNGNYWVLFAATTDQEFTVVVRDSLTGQVKTYRNALGHPANVVIDINAFPNCP